MTQIEKIRQEIERLRKENGKDGRPSHVTEVICTNLLSFLDTLEEKDRPEPYNPTYDEAYLNEKIKKATESWKGVDVDKMLAECRDYDEPKVDLEEEVKRYWNNHSLEYRLGRIADIDFLYLSARHFYELGLNVRNSVYPER